MQQQTSKNPGPGRPVLSLAEADYRFGAGPLHLVVTRVRWNAPQQHDADVWYEVEGTEMTDDGREIGPRTALVRGTTLRTTPNTSRRHGP